MLQRVLDRLAPCQSLDGVLVATSLHRCDDAIAEACETWGTPVFRGSENDVLARYAGALEWSGSDAVVRITADCPLLDPTVVDRVVERFHASGADYASNTLERSYPRGLDVEVVAAPALRRAAAEATEAWERAHVTPYLYRRPERFRLVGVRHSEDHSGHRWTVDTAEDLALVRAVYERLGERPFGWLEVLRLVEEDPELRAINSGVAQKELERG